MSFAKETGMDLLARIALLGCCLVLLAGTPAAAQPSKRVGVLFIGSPGAVADQVLASLQQGLRDHGLAQGRDYVLETRFADGRFERLDGLAAELAQLPADVIVTAGSVAVAAAKKATSSIPIVL